MREAGNSRDAPTAECGWLDWLAESDVPAISGIDTRALVLHIRDAGAMRGGIFPAAIPETRARELIAAEPPMAGQDLAARVTPNEVVLHGTGDGPRIAVIDTGIKTSMVRQLVARGARVSLHPCTSGVAELLGEDPDAVFLANGPGDPGALSYVVETVRALVGRKPVWGICLGHQLLCRAVGLETYKLPFGHRGANHPVKDLQTGRVQITRLRGGRARWRPQDRDRRAGPLADRLRGGRPDTREPV
jgi:carbamoyl-phosphate synthase small subunit